MGPKLNAWGNPIGTTAGDTTTPPPKAQVGFNKTTQQGGSTFGSGFQTGQGQITSFLNTGKNAQSGVAPGIFSQQPLATGGGLFSSLNKTGGNTGNAIGNNQAGGFAPAKSSSFIPQSTGGAGFAAATKSFGQQQPTGGGAFAVSSFKNTVNTITNKPQTNNVPPAQANHPFALLTGAAASNLPLPPRETEGRSRSGRLNEGQEEDRELTRKQTINTNYYPPTTTAIAHPLVAPALSVGTNNSSFSNKAPLVNDSTNAAPTNQTQVNANPFATGAGGSPGFDRKAVKLISKNKEPPKKYQITSPCNMIEKGSICGMDAWKCKFEVSYLEKDNKFKVKPITYNDFIFLLVEVPQETNFLQVLFSCIVDFESEYKVDCDLVCPFELDEGNDFFELFLTSRKGKEKPRFIDPSGKSHPLANQFIGSKKFTLKTEPSNKQVTVFYLFPDFEPGAFKNPEDCYYTLGSFVKHKDKDSDTFRDQRNDFFYMLGIYLKALRDLKDRRLSKVFFHTCQNTWPWMVINFDKSLDFTGFSREDIAGFKILEGRKEESNNVGPDNSFENVIKQIASKTDLDLNDAKAYFYKICSKLAIKYGGNPEIIFQALIGADGDIDAAEKILSASGAPSSDQLQPPPPPPPPPLKTPMSFIIKPTAKDDNTGDDKAAKPPGEKPASTFSSGLPKCFKCQGNHVASSPCPGKDDVAPATVDPKSTGGQAVPTTIPSKPFSFVNPPGQVNKADDGLAAKQAFGAKPGGSVFELKTAPINVDPKTAVVQTGQIGQVGQIAPQAPIKNKKIRPHGTFSVAYYNGNKEIEDKEDFFNPDYALDDKVLFDNSKKLCDELKFELDKVSGGAENEYCVFVEVGDLERKLKGDKAETKVTKDIKIKLYSNRWHKLCYDIVRHYNRDQRTYNEQDYFLTEREKELETSKLELELFERDLERIEEELDNVDKIEKEVDSWLEQLKRTVTVDKSDRQTNEVVENDEAVDERLESQEVLFDVYSEVNAAIRKQLSKDMSVLDDALVKFWHENSHQRKKEEGGRGKLTEE